MIVCIYSVNVAFQREVLKHRGHKIESFSYVIIKKGREEEKKGVELCYNSMSA